MASRMSGWSSAMRMRAGEDMECGRTRKCARYGGGRAERVVGLEVSQSAQGTRRSRGEGGGAAVRRARRDYALGSVSEGQMEPVGTAGVAGGGGVRFLEADCGPFVGEHQGDESDDEECPEAVEECGGGGEAEGENGRGGGDQRKNAGEKSEKRAGRFHGDWERYAVLFAVRVPSVDRGLNSRSDSG